MPRFSQLLWAFELAISFLIFRLQLSLFYCFILSCLLKATHIWVRQIHHGMSLCFHLTKLPSLLSSLETNFWVAWWKKKKIIFHVETALLPLASLRPHGLVYLQCFALIKELLLSSPPLTSHYIPVCTWHNWTSFVDSLYITFQYLSCRQCSGNGLWLASSLKVTSAMTLTCRRHCSCGGGSSSRTRSSKHTRRRWTYSNRRSKRKKDILSTLI